MGVEPAIAAALPAGNIAAIAAATARVRPDLVAPGEVTPALREAWRELARIAAEPNPFAEPELLEPAIRHVAGTGDVRLVLAWQGDRLTGLMPVVRDRRYGKWPLAHWRNWQHANAFLGSPLLAQGAEVAGWRGLLATMDRVAGPFEFLHLTGIPLAAPGFDALAAACADRRRRCDVVLRESRALYVADGPGRHYYETVVRKKKRKELARLANRLAEAGAVAIERLVPGDGAALRRWTDDFLALEAAGWKGREGSALACDPGTAAYFREALEAMDRQHRLDAVSLLLDGRPVAMLATLLAGDGGFSFKTAFDESLSRFSPGVLLQVANYDLPDRRRIGWIDSCASENHPMIDSLWRERREIGRVSIALAGPLRARWFAALRRMEDNRTRARNAREPS